MKQVIDSISRDLPSLRLYEDELRELYSFLKTHCTAPIELRISNYELETLDEISQLPFEKTHSMLIHCDKPYLNIDLSQVSGRLYCGDASVASEGIVSRIEEILKKGKAGRLNLTKTLTSSVIFGSFTGI